MHETPDDRDRCTQDLDEREARIRAREDATAQRERRLTDLDRLLDLREEALAARESD